MMIGMVLAAGAGRRLRPYTDTLPKALVPVDGETTILDIALRNLAAVGLTDVTVVVGYRAEAVHERQADARGAARRPAHPGPQRQGRGVEQLLLAVAGPRPLRPGRAAGERRHRAPGRRRADAAGRCRAARRGGHPARARRPAKTLAEEEMKVTLDERGRMRRITKLMDAGRGRRRVHRRDADPGPARRTRSPPPSRPPGGATRTSTTRTATRRSSTPAARSGSAPIGTAALGRGRQPRRPRPGAGDRVPLLARMLLSPLFIDIRAGAVVRSRRPALRPPHLRRRARRDRGRPRPGRAGGRGDRGPRCPTPTSSPCAAAAWRPPATCRPSSAGKNYDALVGIGGGRTLDVAKYAAMRLGAADGRGRDQPRARRHRLPGQLAAARGRQGLVRRRPADGRGRRPRLRAHVAAADGAVRRR